MVKRNNFNLIGRFDSKLVTKIIHMSNTHFIVINVSKHSQINASQENDIFDNSLVNPYLT